MKRMTIEEIEKYIKENSDCTLVDATNYKSSRDSILKIKCKCGNEFETTFKIFKQGKKQCNECAGKSIMYKNCKYKNGDVIFTKTGKIEVLEFVSIKNDKKSNCRGYKYKCLIDGYIGEIKEKDLEKGQGCTVCGHNKTVKGINDIATTYPELLIYFKNVEESYIYSAHSNKSIKVICPNCGYEKEINVTDLTNQGFGCTVCNDGISLGEKIMAYILLKLDIKFEKEKADFKWLKPYDRRYDFYFKLNDEDILLEINGKQHYEESTGNWKRTLEEEIANDKFKKELAISNGIKPENYIIINCRESNLKWIKEHILESNLDKMFDMSKIDWNECYKNSCISNIIIASELYNNNYSITEISKKLKCGLDTTRDYLQKGTEINITNYTVFDSKRGKSLTQRCGITKEEILLLYNSGKTIKQISEQIGCHIDTIRKYIRSMASSGLCIY